jgi:short-subunit dehydrogenase
VRLSGTTVLVTGASGGIGRAAAIRLHARGARLVLHARDAAHVRELADRLGAATASADLGDPDGPAMLAEQAGRVEVLVHCAGRGLRGPFASTPAPQVDEVLAVNLRAPAQLARALLPGMLSRGRGHLAFVASIAGHTGVGHEAVYAASKAGVLALAESLRLELAASGITVSTVSPGAVDTGFWDARGVPYHRRSPRPIPADRVARVLVAGVERGGGDRIVPRWRAVAPAVRALSPALYQRLAARFDR